MPAYVLGDARGTADADESHLFTKSLPGAKMHLGISAVQAQGVSTSPFIASVTL